MNILSPEFENEQHIPRKFTCQGESVNPELAFEDVPLNTKSLVLIMDDPEATIGTFDHWIVYNISPKTPDVDENSIPDNGIEGLNSTGKKGYIGPCPPSGTHRYFFKLYALDQMLNFGKDPDKKELETAMRGHIIDEAELIGLYVKD